MATKTHLWKTMTGTLKSSPGHNAKYKLVPITEMDNKHIIKAHTRCCEMILYGAPGEKVNIAFFEKWKKLFEEEAKKRKLKLTGPDILTMANRRFKRRETGIGIVKELNKKIFYTA